MAFRFRPKGKNPFRSYPTEKVIFEISILQRDGSTWPAGDSAPEEDEYDEFARGDDEDADIDDESAAIWTEPEGAPADLHTM